MKLKDKIKSYSFWVSLASAIILILKILGNRFGFSIDEGMISDLFTALCSILVLLGIIVVPGSTQSTKSSNEQENKITKNTDFENQQSAYVLENNQELPEQKIVYQEEPIQIETTILNNKVCEEAIQENYIEEIDSKANQDLIFQQNEDSSIEEALQTKFQNIEELEVQPTNIDDIEINDDIKDNLSIEVSNNENLEVNSDISSESFDIKSTLASAREQFAGKIDEYIFELQEEIRKTREGV